MATATTSITFTVDMTTGNSSWSPNWEFSFTLTPSSGATIANVASSAGTLSGTSTYTLYGIPSTSGAKSVTITMNVTGNIYNLHTVDLVITSGKELTYNTPAYRHGRCRSRRPARTTRPSTRTPRRLSPRPDPRSW